MGKDFESYHREKKTIDLYKANVYSLFLSMFWALTILLPFAYIWKGKFTQEYFGIMFSGLGFKEIVFLIGATLAVMVLGIIVHELIHGFFFGLYAKSGFKSISFGFLPKYMAAYCHCNEPLLIRHYFLGALAPGIILGVIPSILALFTGKFAILVFGFFFTVSAVGDLMIIQLLKGEDKNTYVLDHPSEPGCFILKPIQS